MAVPIVRKVIDISHWNTVTSFPAIKDAGIIGIIGKATEGTTYVDPTYHANCAHALASGLLWGAYHFAQGHNVEAQAEHFLKTVGNDVSTLYALDWEDNPSGPTMTAAEAQQWIEVVEKEIGEGRVVVYSGNTAKEHLAHEEHQFFAVHRLWLAQYSVEPVTQASWKAIWLHQYTDGNVGPPPHHMPGVSGAVDQNSYLKSDTALHVEWSGSLRPAGAAIVSTPINGDEVA